MVSWGWGGEEYEGAARDADSMVLRASRDSREVHGQREGLAGLDLRGPFAGPPYPRSQAHFAFFANFGTLSFKVTGFQPSERRAEDRGGRAQGEVGVARGKGSPWWAGPGGGRGQVDVKGTRWTC